MGADMEITIAIRGGEVGVGGAQRADAAGAPAPSPDMTGAVATATGAGDEPPSPVDALGASSLDSGAAPSPEMDGAATSSADASALPEPVPLDDIERLGSSEAAGSGQAGQGEIPEPQGEPE
jgi:hypothetical protein